MLKPKTCSFLKKGNCAMKGVCQTEFFFFTIQGVVTMKNMNQNYMNESAKLLLGSVMEI